MVKPYRGFHPQTQKLEPPYKISSLTLGVRRLSYSGGSNKKLVLLGIGFVLQLPVVQQQYI